MSGDVSLFGDSLYDASYLHRLKLLKNIGVAFQSGALLSSLTVAENVALPLRGILTLMNRLLILSSE